MKRIALLGISVLFVFSSSTRAEDPVYFADPKLKALVEAKLGVSEPTPSDMLALTRLSVCFEGVTSLTGIEHATNLTYLYLEGNEISDVSPLAGLTKLDDLLLGHNEISDISPLASLTNLTRLTLHHNKYISDISPVAALTNLTSLSFGDNQVSDISPVSGLAQLTRLGISSNPISDISAVSGLTNLTYFSASYAQITDISALSGLTELGILSLYYNQISDISALGGLTKLYYLYLSCNQISDISLLSGLPELTVLDLGRNDISDISPLTGFTRWSSLDLIYNPLNRDAYCTHLPQIMVNNPSLSPYDDLYYSANEHPPSNVSASNGTYTNNVRVSWDSVCSVVGSTYYTVYRSESAQGGKVALTGWELGTSFEDTTATPDVTYYYFVKAKTSNGHDVYGYSDYSLPDTGWRGSGADTYTLDTASTAGGSVTVPGEGSYAYAPGTVVSIVAAADADYEFSGWTGTAVSAGRVANAAAVSTTVTMDDDYTVVANFSPTTPTTYSLTTSSMAGGSVTVPGEGSYVYAPGTTVSVVAAAEAGYEFSGWTGTAVSAGKVANPGAASTTVTMDGDYTLVATFEAAAPSTCTLSISSGQGGSVVTPGEGSFSYDHGRTVTLEAAAAPGYLFVEWSGSVHSVSNPTSIEMNADHHVTANFAPMPPALTVSAGEGGRVVAPGEGTLIYPSGTPVRAVALPDAGYAFVGWTGTQVDMGGVADPNGALIEFTFETDATLHASFAPAERCLYVDDDGPGDPYPRNQLQGDPAEDGTWGHPFDSVQEAINAAEDGDAVLVLPGVYEEHVNFSGKNLTVSAFDLCTVGAVSETILAGTGAESVVVFEAGESASAILAGFTIQGGEGELGGGIRCCGADPIVAHCLMAGNRADLGGGVYCEQSRATLANCTIADNFSWLAGGGLHCDGDVTMINSIVYGNQPEQIVADPCQAPCVTYSAVRGGWSGEGNIDRNPYFAAPGHWALPGDAEVSVAPDDPASEWIGGDYHLKAVEGRWNGWMWVRDASTSPCVDAGHPNTPVGCEPLPNGERINMGAYGGTAEASRSP